MPRKKATPAVDHRFTLHILMGMVLGAVVGIALQYLPISKSVANFITMDVLKVVGGLFIALIKMLVVPIVFVSLVHGSSSLGDLKSLGRIGGKTLFWYLLTTGFAIMLAIIVASIFNIGHGLNFLPPTGVSKEPILSFKELITGLVPTNPIKALANGNMLQIIVFALLFGVSLSAIGEHGKKLIDVFESANEAMLRLITMIMRLAPYGVFCLLAVVFAEEGIKVIEHLLGYFLIVVGVLLLQLLAVYSVVLQFIARLNPLLFFRKMLSAMLFAFSVSSSNASIPVVLKTVEEKLGVKNKIAAFVIPLGSTINMDGTAIMQGVATVFIANAYNVHLGFAGYLMVVLMATLASIGTAGVPSVGLITLAMVLQQVGVPVQGIALILGVDRLLDMLRTAVNVSGDAMIACLVGKSEKALDQKIFENRKLID